ncbi:MAG TPA: hydrogenase small subunit [Anaeromyxobacteraceae bacterium]|nr:hydrogenase small subunit [Anaeromyxobacteraceae bacterium]
MESKASGMNGASRTDGVNRRDFLKVCSMAAAAVGLPAQAAEKMAQRVAMPKKPSVVWLQFQECTGCTESLLRTSHPGAAELVLDLISLDYSETLMAAAGHQAEAALQAAMKENAGKYVCVVEGAIPTKDGGVYCKIGDRTALDIVKDVAGKAGAVIAIGSCASWGGIPSADPNPTGAVGVKDVVQGKPLVTIPGCPANPYNLLGTVLQYATFGTLPALDEKLRPKFAYGRVIHDDCPRRPHFDAGRFAQRYGDEGSRQGWCLYKLGCKGPRTHANCSLLNFGDVIGAWPIGVGAQCFGCTEKELAFRVPLFQTVEPESLSPPGLYPPVSTPRGEVSPWATGLAGVAVGALVGAGWTVSKAVGRDKEPGAPPDEKKE